MKDFLVGLAIFLVCYIFVVIISLSLQPVGVWDIKNALLLREVPPLEKLK